MSDGYLITIAGCPHYFTTWGCDDPVSWASAGDEPAGATISEGRLVDPEWSWSETLNPITGELEVSSLGFVLEDFGDEDGYPLITYLGRPDEAIAATELAASMDADDTTFTVKNGALLGTGFPKVLWVEGEAILCQSRTDEEITVATGGRGYLGTRAASHLIDSGNNVYPTVWAEFAGWEFRKVIAWRVIDGVAYPLWRGRIEAGPESRDEDHSVTYAFHAEHAWTWQKRQLLGVPDAICYLRGYNVAGIELRVTLDQTGNGIPSTLVSKATDYGAVHTSLESALEKAAQHLRVALQTYGLPRHTYVDFSRPVIEPTGIRWSVLTTNAAGGSGLGISLRVGDVASAATASQNTGLRSATVVVGTIPDAIVVFDSGLETAFPIDRTDGLPTDWTPQEYSDSEIYETSITPVLRGEYSDDHAFEILPSSASPVDPDHADVIGPAFVGFGALAPRSPYGRALTGHDLVMTGAFPLRVTAKVESDHWAYALKRVLSDDVVVRSQADVRDWDFSEESLIEVVDATSDQWAARRLHLDGSQTVEEFVTSSCGLSACAPAIHAGGKIGVTYLGPPTVHTSIIAEITQADILDDEPAFGRIEGMRNAVQIESDLVKLLVRDARSIARYQQTYKGTLMLSGLKFDAAAVDNPVALASNLLSRYLTMWSRPRRWVAFTLPLAQWHDQLHQGDWIKLTCWLIPNDAGGRGVSDVFARVIERHVDASGEGTMRVKAMLYSSVYGYAPCVRVESIDGATITAAVEYVRETTDYSGSNEVGYFGTQDDGGVSLFKPGFACELIQRDVDTYTSETGLVVQSVNPGARTITFTTSPSTTIGMGEIWDLRFDAFATVAAEQQRYAYVGDKATGVIDGTDTRNQEWGP